MTGGQFHDLKFTDDPLSGVIAAGSILRSGFRSEITSWSDLAAVVTAGSLPPFIIEWYDPSAELMRTVVGDVGTDATDTANGVQRANDWAASGIVWLQIGGAG